MQTLNEKEMPGFMDEYLKAVQLDDRKPSLDLEIAAYRTMQNQILNETSPVLKQIMQHKLQKYCEQYVDGTHSMLLSYLHESYWNEEINRDNKILSLSSLYSELEEILAGASDSSGYTKGAGVNKRYPITVPHLDGTVGKPYYLSIGSGTTPEEFMNAYYSFGVHKFYTGKTLIEIIEFLEQRYGIDFEQLEKGLNF